MSARVRDVETPQGTARLHVHPAGDPVGTLVLGHGAGGRDWPGDTRILADALPDDGWTVVLVDQPWRVAGKRVASRPAALDAAWVPVLAQLPRMLGEPGQRGVRPLVVGGRSAGARVACRTAAEVGADAVLCLSFPLHPPGRPERSRADELRAPIEAGLPVHVIQGTRDPFGSPDELTAEVPATVHVSACAGSHSFGKAPRDVLEAARGFLTSLLT